MDSAVYLRMASAITVASYPGRIEGEKQPGIDCLRMRDNSQTWEFVYAWKLSVNQYVYVRYIQSVSLKGAAVCRLNTFNSMKSKG